MKVKKNAVSAIGQMAACLYVRYESALLHLPDVCRPRFNLAAAHTLI
jgi:hypothetical protein